MHMDLMSINRFLKVRLSSAQALRSCLDDFDFVPEQFAPYMQDTFFYLFGLLKDVRESDNKVRKN